MGHTFISYAREDRAKAQAIASALEATDVEVWLDDRLVAGSHYDDAIEQALAEADKVIVAWSPAASASQWVRAEAGEGSERGILVPVLIEPTRIPLEFRRIQTVDLTEWQGDSDHPAFRNLLAALNVRVGRAPEDRLRAEKAADKHKTRNSKEVSAEITYANNAFTIVNIVVRLGSDSTTISHSVRRYVQQIDVDGVQIYAGRCATFKEHHKLDLKY